MANASSMEKYPETLEEAISYAKAYETMTGQQIETIPNPDASVYFNLVDRTKHCLDFDDAGSIIEIVSSGDTGRELSRSTVLSKETMEKIRRKSKEITER